MTPYEIIEHTADVGVRVYGRTLKHLFENAARGMFSLIAGEDILSQNPPENLPIKIEKHVRDYEELLVDWLSELLYIFNKERTLFFKFEWLKLDKKGLSVMARGKKAERIEREIKAVTFHDLNIKKDREGFSVTVIFDV